MDERDIEHAQDERETAGGGTGGIGGGQFPGEGYDESLGDAGTGGHAGREATGAEPGDETAPNPER